MPKQPLAIDASTVLATKSRQHSAARPAARSEALVDLNFKVPASFRKHFKQLALDADLKNVQLLRRAIEAYERELAGTESRPSPVER